MFRLFDALVEGRLLGGVSPRIFGGGEVGGPPVTTIDLARGGGAAEAERIGPLETFGGFKSPNADPYGGAVAWRDGGGGGKDALDSPGGA